MTTTTVFVSGANGFIAQHTVQQLLQSGYKVIGSVRSAEKGEKLKKVLNSDKFSYVIIPNIADVGAFDKVLKENKDITVFLHIASPFRFNIESTEKDILIPAIEGTRNVLTSIKENAPQITRVVVTSSDAAARENDDKNPNLTLDENSWNNATYDEAKKDPVSAYLGSKGLAEKLAWNFVKTEKVNFKLATVLPSYTFGPQIADELVLADLNSSSKVFEEILTSTPESVGLYTHNGSFIDVRDAAKAHILAFEKEDAVNKRLLLSSGRFTSQTIRDILVKKFPQLKGKIFEGVPGEDVEEIKQMPKLDYSQTEKVLGIKYRPLEVSSVDAVSQLLRVRGQ
ncbi:protein induced by osmotic stress [Scheffersomyces xylosifermentans]|uniref:protein induced by osmotic stress n=1 Tax=Scheffersomyces xylosifermentans TaxID=1304137 RepID=UPI00315CA750